MFKFWFVESPKEGDSQVTGHNIFCVSEGCHVFRMFVKGKAIPVYAWTGRSGSKRLRFPEFLGIRHMKVGRLS